jgi:hypothetical protein
MSGAAENEGFNLDERDRLPWLEPAGMDEELERPSTAKVAGLVALGLALLAVIVGGGYWLKTGAGRSDRTEAARLIPAQGKSYKIPANESDAKSFDGEGDEAFEASAGGEAGGRIDASKVPEAPRTDLKPAAAPAAAPVARPSAKPSVTAAVKTVPAPAKTAAAAAGGASGAAGGARVQLGAFGSKPLAEDVWKKLSARFDYLAALSHSVEPVETGGKTLYRLRVAVASAADATATCGKLRVAGENCMVVR